MVFKELFIDRRWFVENGRLDGDGQLDFKFPEFLNPRVLKLRILLVARGKRLLAAYKKIADLKEEIELIKDGFK